MRPKKSEITNFSSIHTFKKSLIFENYPVYFIWPIKKYLLMPSITGDIKEITVYITVFPQWATIQKSDLGFFPRQLCKKPITYLVHIYCSYPSS